MTGQELHDMSNGSIEREMTKEIIMIMMNGYYFFYCMNVYTNSITNLQYLLSRDYLLEFAYQ